MRSATPCKVGLMRFPILQQIARAPCLVPSGPLVPLAFVEKVAPGLAVPLAMPGVLPRAKGASLEGEATSPQIPSIGSDSDAAFATTAATLDTAKDAAKARADFPKGSLGTGPRKRGSMQAAREVLNEPAKVRAAVEALRKS